MCTVVLPQLSAAVHVLVSTYALAHDPDTLVSLKVTVAVPQLSVAVNVTADGTSDEHE